MMKKNEPKIYYDKVADVLWFMIKAGFTVDHTEIIPGVSLEIGEKGEIMGIEILDATEVLGEIFGKNLKTSKIANTPIATFAHKIQK